MNLTEAQALDAMAEHGERLCTYWHLEWPEPVRQAVLRLRFDLAMSFARSREDAQDLGTKDSDAGVSGGLDLAGRNESPGVPVLATMIGGASSGKSTVFDNLLGGHLVSRITARGHTTLGPVVAIHERFRSHWQRWLDEGLVFPGFLSREIELDDNVTGAPEQVAVLYHAVAGLENVLLFDMPDFTSLHAQKEGDVTMSLLPWFDRIAIVVDHERWFDRQVVSTLRSESVRLGQMRWVLFNRTQEGALGDADRDALSKQMVRLGAEGSTVLEFRRGRGLSQFPPATLDAVRRFLSGPPPSRQPAMRAFIADAANKLLNQNHERSARIEELRTALVAARQRAMPTDRQCLIQLATSDERAQLEWVSRVLRIHETRAWFAEQTRRFHSALGQVPLLGALVGRSTGAVDEPVPKGTDRRSITAAHFEAVSRRFALEVRHLSGSSTFWDEVRRWTGIEPAPSEFAWDDGLRSQVDATADALDKALVDWVGRVEKECKGVSPHVRGAVSVGTVALGVVLIAAPGSLAVLTLAAAKTAIAAGITKLAVATGAGALAGKPLTRLIGVIQEKLLASSELKSVQEVTRAYRRLLESTLRRLSQDPLSEASALVLPRDDRLVDALETLRDVEEESP